MLEKYRKLLDERKISSLELTREYLKKIKEKNNELNCYISVFDEIAEDMAKKADDEILKGRSSSLCGIPLSIKDNLCMEGTYTTCASKMLKDYISPYDATVVKKLKNENAVILGKTGMDEFSMGSTSKTSTNGGVKNPINKDYYPGGSSGGSACCVAAGLSMASLGSDTGGSVRNPAAYCGVTGIKPTYSRVSRYGLVAFSSSLDQIGVIANSIIDCAYILNAITGYDKKDMTSSNMGEFNYLKSIGMNINGLKIGLPDEIFNAVSDEIKEHIKEVIKFYEDMGAEFKRVKIPTQNYAHSVYKIISSAEVMSNLLRYDGIKYGYFEKNSKDFNDFIINSRSAGFGEEVKKRIMIGNFVLAGDNYEKYFKKSIKIREKMKFEYDDALTQCDMILTPTTADILKKISQETDEYKNDLCTVGANLTGLPAISIPFSKDKNGMPVSFSLVGRAFQEDRIIAVSDAYQKKA